MPYKEKKIEKKYYSIGEVAFQFKVAPSLIRFWEKEFDFLKPQKNKKGNRQFTKEDIARFEKVYKLVKEEGYTLQGAKEYLKSQGKDNPKTDTVETLQNIKKFLENLRDKL